MSAIGGIGHGRGIVHQDIEPAAYVAAAALDEFFQALVICNIQGWRS